jgi:hypothetical protein
MREAQGTGHEIIDTPELDEGESSADADRAPLRSREASSEARAGRARITLLPGAADVSRNMSPTPQT